MKEFIAISNSTIYDVCLNTYGTLNYLAKLMYDSGHDGVDTYPENGQIFLYDETLVYINNSTNLERSYSVTAGNSQLKYATK